MKKGILSFVLALWGIAHVANGQVVEDWVVELHEAHVYSKMPYRLMRPIRFDPAKRYPVIVSLHGAGGRGADNLRQLRHWNGVLAEQKRRTDYPAFIVAPQTTVMWNTTHLQNIKDIIKNLPSVDMNRIYILGHSMGGEWPLVAVARQARGRSACRKSRLMAAGAPLAHARSGRRISPFRL